MKHRQTVLIVEDDAINRKILKKLISDCYSAIEAENGAEACSILDEKRGEIAAVLLDIYMPVMDGFGVLDKISKSNMTNLPVIVTTSASDEISEQKALEAGAWDFVTKPINPKILMSRLNNAVARSQIDAVEHMLYLSEHDELTGLYNRRKMFEETQKMLDTYPEEKFVFIRMDIDHFSLYNTSFGEEEGNILLSFLAKQLKIVADHYEHSVCGRISADVFCGCLTYGGNQQIVQDEIKNIKKSISEYRSDYSVEISVGACIINERNSCIDKYYFRATTAAQKCKNQYDMHIAFYDETVGKQIETELAIANEMQNALVTEQFAVYFQPKFDLSTGKPCGAESLVRWVHPVNGIMSPKYFIPIFERNGFIAKLDYYMWEQTCRLIKSWIDMGKRPYPVSVNISRISLYNPMLSKILSVLVKQYNIPASLLQLEVTESAYMTNPELMEETIKTLHDEGFTILMDDFGSGYSSLNTLKTIDVDILKVDMKFLPINEEVGRAEIILASVIKMAKWLGMGVVVEGVENRQQRDFLKTAGCDYVQGHYYSEAIPAKEYEEKYAFNSEL